MMMNLKHIKKSLEKCKLSLQRKNLFKDSTSIAAEKVIYEEELALAQESFNNRKDELGLLEEEFENSQKIDITMKTCFIKAKN